MRIVYVAAPPDQTGHASILADEAIRQLSELHPEHDWTLLEGITRPDAFSFFKRRKIIRELRELQPDVLLYASPHNLQPVDSIPLVVFVNEPLAGPAKHFTKALPSVKTILTDTTWLANQLKQKFSLSEEKVKQLRWMGEEVESEWPHNQLTKEKYTSGNDYFYYGGPIINNGTWERILQAFSHFKKWQQSSLQMVLAGPVDDDYRAEFAEKLEAYRYRKEVAWLTEADDTEKKHLFAGAFGMLANGGSFTDRLIIRQAFRSGIPVITDQTPVMEEIAGDAALYADWKDATSLSKQMISLYKNEDLTNSLVQKAKQKVTDLSWQQTLDELYRTLMPVAEH